MTYKMITPAERGWFFVQSDQAQVKKNNQQGPIMLRIAAWALTEEGNVVGLLGAGIRDGSGDPDGKQTFLYEPDPLANGEYKHFNDLTKAELNHLGSDSNRPGRQNI